MEAREFINAIAPLAVAEQKRTGVLASITIAQAALESAWGRSAPGNNLFGIKGSGTTQETREYINGEWVTIKAGFRSYPGWKESIEDHSNLLTKPRYVNAGFLDACRSLSFHTAAYALQKAGYATDPDYAAKLISIIRTHFLDAYDRKGDPAVAEWKENIMKDARAAGLIDDTHKADDTASKWFVLAIALKVLRGISKK